jgi:nitrate reductase gamma subunit
MSSAEFLLWVRGPGLEIAVIIFAFGIILRLLEIFLMGRKKTLAEKRGSGAGGGVRTIASRFAPADSATFRRSIFIIVAGYIFHIGLFVTLFLFVPHIELFDSQTGIAWPGLPTPVVDFFAVISMIALLALLWNRLTKPVLRLLSTGHDYLVWALTFLPLLTGYMAYHHLFFEYNWLLAVHILSVELLLVLFPFTKLMHAVTVFISRWYTGYMAGEKGVKV